MNVEECANQQLKAEFPLMFGEKQPVSVRLAEIKRAEELLGRDNRTDPAGVAEMRRQLEVLRETLTKKLGAGTPSLSLRSLQGQGGEFDFATFHFATLGNTG
ncbi:MAG: hypothetical protein WAM78_19280 [Candidatus Sulfotelmatobacter sp.]